MVMWRFALALFSLLLAWPGAGWGATPTHDATTQDSDNNAQQNPTASHTRGATCPNPVAIISIGWQLSTPPSISSVTYDGNAATSLAAALTVSADSRLQPFIYKNPPSGAATVQVNFSTQPNDSTIRVSTYCNVDQTTSTGTVASASANSTTPSVNVSSASGEVVVDAVMSYATGGSNATLTVDGSQTQRANFFVSGNHRHGASEEAGAATVTMSWSLSASKEWGIFGFGLKPSTDSTCTGGLLLRGVGGC